MEEIEVDVDVDKKVEVLEKVEEKKEVLSKEMIKVITELKEQFPVWKVDKKDESVIWVPKCKSSCKNCFGKGIVTAQFVEKGERFDKKHMPDMMYHPCPKHKKVEGIDLKVIAEAMIKAKKEKDEEIGGKNEKG